MDLGSHVCEIAKEAGALVRSFAEKRDLAVYAKGSSYDYVTEADLGSQNLIKELAARYYPQDRVIGEEDGLSDAEIVRMIDANPKGSRLWVVDPLDGTVNFIRGMLGYGISIGVFQGTEVVAGAIYQPDTGDLYHAEKGAGAYKNNRRIRVSEHGELNECIGGTHVPVSNMIWRAHANLWNSAASMQCQNLRMLGAAIYEQSRVADGGIDFYYELGPHPWDVAAGKLLVEEAGGKVSDLTGGTFRYGIGGVIISNGAVHDKVVRMLAQSDPQLTELL